MTGLTFTPAVKHKERIRLALDGPAGGGKTWTALTVAAWIASQEGGTVAVLDSERSSARKYADHFTFDHLELPNFKPETYTQAIRAAINGGYCVIVVDSLSHAWEGTLEMKDEVTKRSRSKNSFDAWREVTPVHNELVDAMLRAPAHVIATLRTKTEFVVDKNDEGKTTITRMGLKPIQRDGVEYEFDVVGELDLSHTMCVTKTRCHALADAVIRKPGDEFAEVLWSWAQGGEERMRPAKGAKQELVRVMGDRDAAAAVWAERFPSDPSQVSVESVERMLAAVADDSPFEVPDGE